jgi:hypothetical protein
MKVATIPQPEVERQPFDRTAANRDTLACAEPVFLFGDTGGIACLKNTESRVLDLEPSRIDVITKATKFASLHVHCLTLAEQDWRNRFRHLIELRLVPNWLLGYIERSHETKVREGGTWREELYRRRLVQLVSMCDEGLLVSEGQLLREIQARIPASEDHARIECVGIPTCRRPQHLEQGLESLAENLKEFGRFGTRLLVVDDSNDRSWESANRAVFENCRRKYGSVVSQISYYGSQLRARLIRLLAQTCSIPEDVITFALDPPRMLPTHGAARNALTLLTVGNCLFETDDDTLCAYHRVGGTAGVRVSAALDPCDCIVYASHEANCAANAFASPLDALAIHEQYLSKSVGEILCNSPQIEWQELRSDLISILRSGEGRIGVTSTGCMGDCGLYSSAGFITAASVDSIRRVFETEEGSERALTTREMMHCVPEFTVSRGASFHSMSFAVDNRILIPPFFPMGRNEDGTFAILSSLCDSSFWIGHLPWAIRHCSEPGRKYLADYIEGSVRVRLGDVVGLLVRSLSVPAATRRTFGLRSAGEQLRCIADMPARSFGSYLTLQYVRSRNAMIRTLEERVMQDRLPRYWMEKAVGTIRAIRLSLREPANSVPADLASEVGPVRALEYTQEIMRLFGKLLVHWDELVWGAHNSAVQNLISTVD